MAILLTLLNLTYITLALLASIFVPTKGNPFEINLIISIFLIMLFAVFQVALLPILERLKNTNVNLVIVQFMLMTAIVLLTKPIFSQDVYWNMLMSKAFLLDGLNPYTNTANDAQYYDLFNKLHVWQDIPMTHGPISIYFYALPYLFTKSDLVALTVLRTIMILVIVISAVLLSKILKQFYSKQEIYNRICLFLFSPLLIINGVLDVHNDVLVMLSILGSLYFLTKKSYKMSVLSLLLGGLVKYVPIILIPLPLIMMLKNTKDNKEKTKELIIISLTALILVALAYLPFRHTLLKSLSGFLFQLGYTKINSMTFITYILSHVLHIPNLVLKIITTISGIVLAIFFLNKNKLNYAYAIPIIVIMAASTTWLTSWYLLWIVPILLINKDKLNSIVIMSFFILNLAFSTFLLSGVFAYYVIGRYLGTWLIRRKFNE